MLLSEQNQFQTLPDTEISIRDLVSQTRAPSLEAVEKQISAGSYMERYVKTPKGKSFSRWDSFKAGTFLRYPTKDKGQGLMICGLDLSINDYQFSPEKKCTQFVEMKAFQNESDLTTVYSFDVSGKLTSLIRELRLADRSRIRETRNFLAKPDEANYQFTRLNSSGFPLEPSFTHTDPFCEQKFFY
jgi:hypothetical protein